jgi:cysteinyl-tRNA synthetase
MDDILKRTLRAFGYKVKHVQNVTDVGHLSSDADSGEDKMEKGAAKTGKNVWEVAESFTKHFYDSMDKLNIERPDIICKATEHIPEQIALVKRLFENGFAYDTPEAVYFDVSKFPKYGELFGQRLDEKKIAVRAEVKEGEHKRHPYDFALWFKRVGRFSDHAMHWDSPWGDGFPGWHIECSAMSMKYLGEQFDIHTGGEDHISIHHPNEIAQAEGATGKSPFVRFWLHTAFLTVDGTKMSKSLNNFYTVEDVEKKGFDPLSLRYFYLTANYRRPLNFTWDALKAAENTLVRLKEKVSSLPTQNPRNALSSDKLSKIDEMGEKFMTALGDDLNTPQALSVVWEMLDSSIPSEDKYDLAMSFDEVLGLGIKNAPDYGLLMTDEVKELIDKREEYRRSGDYQKADEIRSKIETKGFKVIDTSEGAEIKPLK